MVLPSRWQRLAARLNPKSSVPSELVRVFAATWKVIRRKGRPSLNPRQETRRRLHLARCIIALAESGITDATELRRQAIEQFLLGGEPDGSPLGEVPCYGEPTFEPSKNSN